MAIKCLQKIIVVLKNWQKSKKTDNDFEAAKLALPPIAKTYDILCRFKGRCGAKTTNIISWLGTAARDGSGYYPALLNEFASSEVIADLEGWSRKPAETEQNTTAKIGRLLKRIIGWILKETWRLVVIIIGGLLVAILVKRFVGR